MNDHGQPIWLVERDALSEALSNFVETQINGRVKAHYAQEIGNIDFEKKQIEYASTSRKSEEIRYDLLVGADGANSFVREKLRQYDPSIKVETKSLDMSWKSFTGLPRIDKMCVEDEKGTTVIFIAFGKVRMTAWPSKNNTVAGTLAQKTEDFTPESNNAEAYKKLIEFSAPYYPKEWIEETARQLVDAPLSHIRTAWCSTSAGPSTILLGDAANAVSPALGQGLNSALESCLIFAKELDKHEDVDAACQSFNEKRHPELHALFALDREAPLRMGQKGFSKIAFLARMALQFKVWKWLHQIFPSVFGIPVMTAMMGNMSYSEVLKGCKRDENIVRTLLTFAAVLVAILAFKSVQYVFV